MISLDVVAMFTNIPLDLVKKAVSNRWIKVKSHTKLDKKEFLKGFYFRYVDDTLLCVPLDKLQKVIDTFNHYHPRI